MFPEKNILFVFYLLISISYFVDGMLVDLQRESSKNGKVVIRIVSMN